jgi:hypothetical protein
MNTTFFFDVFHIFTIVAKQLKSERTRRRCLSQSMREKYFQSIINQSRVHTWYKTYL